MRITIGSLAVMAMLLSSSGVSAQQDKSHNDAFVQGSPDESRIAHQVRHELVMLPYYGIFDDLAFRVDDSTVTLLGAVTRPVLKSDAENVVKRVEGVTKVINNIEVLPPSPMDDQIRKAEFRAIYGDPSIGTKYGYQALPSIHIIVKNGHVTLEGVVDSEFDKTLINTRANAIPNVFSVTNNLRVASSREK